MEINHGELTYGECQKLLRETEREMVMSADSYLENTEYTNEDERIDDLINDLKEIYRGVYDKVIPFLGPIVISKKQYTFIDRIDPDVDPELKYVKSIREAFNHYYLKMTYLGNTLSEKSMMIYEHCGVNDERIRN